MALSITQVSKKGNGVGTTTKESGKAITVEVPFAIPGDEVETKLRHKKRQIHYGKLEMIKKPSPDRIEPRCAHFGVCGGCRWQQTTYEKQLEFKNNFVLEHFQTLVDENTVLYPIIPSKIQWQYRNKMEFSFSSDSQNRRFLGLFMDSQRGKVLNLTECHLVNPWFMEALEAARAWWADSELDAFHPMRDTGSLRNLTLREGQRTGDRMVVLTVSGNPEYALKQHDLESFVAYIRKAVEPADSSRRLSIFLRIQQTAKGMATNFYEMHLYGDEYIREILKVQTDPTKPTEPLTFSIGPTSFFQPNSIQAEIFYSKAIQLMDIQKDDVIYDLYCGTGTLGICVAPHAKQVIGVELSPESALDAKTNAAHNNIDNINIISGAVRYVLKQIQDEGVYPSPDIVMIDPPRPGLDPLAMKHLVELNPPKILYLSCNPKTQADDIAVLKENGYKVKIVQPIDQFPQTYHVENIVVLTRE